MDCGIYYDDTKEVVYVGGGYHSGRQQVVEYYEIMKDEWMKLPDTKEGHDMNPLIWIEDYNILHIMSVSGNCIECIDFSK